MWDSEQNKVSQGMIKDAAAWEKGMFVPGSEPFWGRARLGWSRARKMPLGAPSLEPGVGEVRG